MACKQDENKKGKPTTILVGNWSDLKFDTDGNLLGLKRKYGKFNRPIMKFQSKPE